MPPKTIPILASDDFDRTVEFYGALGFECVGRWPGEYLILRRRGGIELHFWCPDHVDPATSEIACYVRFDDRDQVTALHREWSAAETDGGRLHDPTETDYGMLEGALVDPHGNLIRFGA